MWKIVPRLCTASDHSSHEASLCSQRGHIHSLDGDVLLRVGRASSRLLDRQRDLSLETRGLAIAMFYAIGTAIGGIAVPLLFGILIAKHSTWLMAGGYVVAAALMCDSLTTFGTIIG